ncbi:MAG: VOC family protein [Opitutaceae bacterium]
MNSQLQLRSVHLRVADLTRSVDFYSQQVGLSVTEKAADRAKLAAPDVLPGSEPLLVLTEDRSAPPPAENAAGLFHAALLLPSRAALGRWLRAAEKSGVRFAGFSDHGVSEAAYFSDPDGNGLEFYVDRPRDLWPYENGELAMITEPLNLRSLFAAADGSPGETGPLLKGAYWGHFHFRVTNSERSEKFYREALGVTLTQRYGTSARFLSAQGYHHHIGLNTWGQPRLPHSDVTLGLVDVSLAVAAAGDSRTLRDPDGITLRVTGRP